MESELRQARAAAALRHLRPALLEESRNASSEGKKVLRVQTEAQRMELGVRGGGLSLSLGAEPLSGCPSFNPFTTQDRACEKNS